MSVDAAEPSFVRPGFPAAIPCIRVKGATTLLDFMRSVLGATAEDPTYDGEGRLAYAVARWATDGAVEVSEARERFDVLTAGIHLYVPDVEAVHARALSAGCAELYAPADMPYGERSSGVEDAFGNQWYLARYTGDDGAEPDDA